MESEKRQLEEDIDRWENRISRAEKLVVLLEDEGIRWKETVSNMEREIEELVGNVFLSAACISYFRAFTWFFRWKLVLKVVRECKINSCIWEVWHHHNYGIPSHHSRMKHCITSDRSDFNRKCNSRNTGTTLTFDDRPIEQSKKWIRNISMHIDFSNWDLSHRTSFERLEGLWVLENQC